jgi:hypothetical protein
LGKYVCMKIQQLLEEYSLEKSRIDHLDDLVFEGSAGVTRAVNALKEAAANPRIISFKPDGSPALVWGRDDNGFSLVDKHAFKGGPLPHSARDLAQLLANRGPGREQLIAKLTAIWPLFEQTLPANFKGFFMGDLMYASRPPIQNGDFVFTPNTVEYHVAVNSELGKQINHSAAGIVVHSFFPMPNVPGKHLSNLQGLNHSTRLLLMNDIAHAKSVQLPDVDKIEKFSQANAEVIDSFLSMKGVPELLKRFINAKVRERNFNDLENGFLQWMVDNSSATKQADIMAHIKANKLGLAVVFKLFSALSSVKNYVVQQLDSIPNPLMGFIDGKRAQEGFIIHTAAGPIKLVDRFKFSAANFAKNDKP